MYDFAVFEGLIFWCSISTPRLHQHKKRWLSTSALYTWNSSDCGRMPLSFFIAARPPATFFLTDSYCSSHPKVSSTITPRYFVLSTRLIISLFMNNCGNDSPFFLLRGWSTIMYSVFVGLRLSLLILIHSAIVISVSSAYMLALERSRQCTHSKSFK